MLTPASGHPATRPEEQALVASAGGMRTVDVHLARHVWETSSILCLRLNRAGVILEANKKACALLGDDCVGRTLARFCTGYELDLAELFASAQRPRLVGLLNAAHLPESFWFRFTDLGDEVLAVGEADVAEIAELQRSIVLTNHELANLTRELHQKARELERLNHLKNELLGVAAHDLRSPLCGISQASEVLLDAFGSSADQESLMFLEELDELSRFGLKIVSDLLDVAAIEAGHLVLERRPTELVPLVQRVVRTSGALSAKRGITIDLDVRGEIGSVTIDPLKMRQVLDNLLSNAAKFSPLGAGVRVELEGTAREVVVRVVDHGQGIPSDELSKLFKPFGRTSVTSESGERSTGLGLAIAQKIVTAHGGRIGVESAPGRGTTMTFSLPRDGA